MGDAHKDALVDWYFDFISPFSYIALHRLRELPGDIAVNYRPVLFAGLLGHWGQKGPAEIPEIGRAHV